jgi:hypothetical protein
VQLANCQVKTLSITQHKSESALTSNLIRLNSTHFTVDSSLEYNFKFSIMAKDIRGNKAWKNYQINFNKPLPLAQSNPELANAIVTKILSLKNEPPVFDQEPLRVIHVDIFKSADGELRNSSTFSYESPKVSDIENDEIKISCDSIIFGVTFTSKKDSFVIKVIRPLIGKSFT